MDVVVPAHDEEGGIARTVRSLLAVDYPRAAFRVVVVADNCSDRTADIARRSGADVLVRQDAEHPGKGYALRFAFDHVLHEGRAEAAVVVDADSIVSPNLLAAFAARFATGAPALQAHYGVGNAKASWRTRLLAIAFASFHGVRSLARERLGLSCGLRGNGMAFRRDVLLAVPHEAWSVVEDLEYGIQLACAGYRVHYVAEAEVLGLMPASEVASRSQRRRWEGGRRAMARAHGLPLLRRAWSDRSLLLTDLALDVLVPPLSTLVLGGAAGLAACAALAAVGQPMRVAPWLFVGSLVLLGVHVLRGWALSATGVRGLVDLTLAPVYVAWKLLLRATRSDHRPNEWVRTQREGRDPAE
jgi:cellulose synthase/poly-beta-1,6-N-acetylglucosamine synthase-like glycosyltransferase